MTSISLCSISLWGLFLIAALPVDVTSLSGEQASGTLVKLTAEELSLQPESGPVRTLPTADLLDIRISGDRPPAGSDGEKPPTVRIMLVDGSQLQVSGLETSAKELRGRHALLGEIKLPMPSVRSVRFTPPSAKIDPLWTQLMEKGTKGDMIVLQKGEVLDHLDGVVGQIDPASIKFLLDGDEIPVKREKAFGIIYARKPSSAKLAARVELANGDSLAVKSVSATSDEWKLDTPSGAAWTLAASGIAAVDFSLGKVVYLSTLEPRDVKYANYTRFLGEPEADFLWKFRRDRSLEGSPIRVGQKVYARGLAIHSRTELKYRLGGEYRRFQAMLGIDDVITKYGVTDVRILGDRKELFSVECRPRQAAIPLDLDVTDVVELEIIVDFGADKVDWGDRVHLADARLVK